MRATGSTASANELASALKGDAYWSRKSNPRETVQRGPLMEGMYTGEGVHRFRRSVVPCPYCRESMTEAFGEHPHRIARVIERRADGEVFVVGVRVPDTHRILGCRTCGAAFTVPKKRRASATSVDAVDPAEGSDHRLSTRDKASS